jgi:hypothetical protein
MDETVTRLVTAHHPPEGETGCPEWRRQVHSPPRCARPWPGVTVDDIRPEEDIVRTWPAASTAATTTAVAAACITLGLSLAACGSPAHPASSSTGRDQGASSTGATQGGSGQSETESIVRCYRAHGDPGFPDPVYDPSDGRWHFAVSPGTAPQATQRACQSLFPVGNPSPPVPQAQFQALVRLAQCVRAHGEPSWPDPNPQGQFPLPPALLNKSPAQLNAMRACQRYVPSGGLDVVAAP